MQKPIHHLATIKPSVKIDLGGSKSNYNYPSGIQTGPVMHDPAPEQRLLSCSELMDKILAALEAEQPLSIVSMGATEAFVMAQYGIFSEEEFMRHREAYIANLGKTSGFLHRGIRFPNIRARDEAVEAVRKADIVGYNTIVNDAVVLARRVFKTYNLNPPYVFEANLRRVFMFSQREKFARMLAGRRLLLISGFAQEAKEAMEAGLTEKLGFQVVGAIRIFEYEEIPEVKSQLDQYDFDLVFLAAGVNALILAPYIAEKYGKVAIDIGSAMQSFISGFVVTDSWILENIGIENLFYM